MSSVDVSQVPIESPIPWIKFIVICVAVIVLLPKVAELVREVWIHVTVTRHMRKRGYPGPSLSLFKNYAKELKQLHLKQPSGPLLTSSGALSHDIEPLVFPSLYTWRTLYGIHRKANRSDDNYVQFETLLLGLAEGDQFIFKRGPRVHLHTSDSEAIKEILTKREDYDKCKAVDSKVMDILGAKGLVFAEHEEWVRQRRVVRSAYYPDRSKKMVVQMASWIEIWLQGLDKLVVENGGSLDMDMQPQLYNLTKDILARSSFGSSFEKGKEGFKHMENQKKLLVRQELTWNPFYRWMPSVLKKQMSKEKREVVRCVLELIRDRRNSIQSGNYESYGDDLLGLLLADRDRSLALQGRPPGDLETEDEHIADQCRTFFFAGGETVYGALVWATVLLGHYIDWQERIRAEVQEVFQGTIPDGDKLMKLKQLNMFVEETLRLYPPAILVNRQVSKNNITLLGEPLPKHLVLLINFCALLRDKGLWGDDALEFKPERFSNGTAKACKKPNVVSAFGSGPRTCVAQSFAMTEIKIVLAMLVQRFSIRLSPSYRHEPMVAFGLLPKFGAQIVLEHVQPATVAS